MTLSLMQLTRYIGLLKDQDILTPKVMDLNDFRYPRESLILWLEDNASVSDPILKNSKKPVSFITPYITDNGIGKYSKAPISHNKIIANHKSIDDTIEYVNRADNLLKVSSTRDIIIDYSELNTLFKYSSSKDKEYALLKNPLITMFEDMVKNTYVTRIEYLPLEIPNHIPKYEDVLKMLKYDNYRIFKFMEDPLFYPHLEVIKYFFKEYRESSIFNMFNNIQISSLNILLYKGNGVTMFSPPKLFSMSKDTEFSYQGLNKKDPKQLLKMYLAYLVNISNRMPLLRDDLSKGKVEEVKEEEVDVIIEKHNETNKQVDPIENDDIISETITKHQDPIKVAEDTTVYIKERGLLSEKVIKENLLQVTEIIKELESTEISKEDRKSVKTVIPVTSVIDKSMLKTTIEETDRHYMEKIYDKQQKSVILSMSKTGLPITDIEEDIVDNLSNRERVISFDMKQLTGQKKKIKIRIPHPDKDGVIRSNGSEYKMIKQRIDLPIKKTRPTEVALTSYYGKLFLRRADKASNDLSRFLAKQFTKMSNDIDSPLNLYVTGSNIVLDTNISQTYLTIGRDTRSFIYNKILFMFHYQDRDILLLNKKDDITKIEKLGTLVGSYKNYYIITNENNLIEVDLNGKLIKEYGDLLQYLEIYNTPYEYVNIKILGDTIPAAIPLIYYKGLHNLLKELKINYRFKDNKRDMKDGEFAIRFIDGYLIMSRNQYYATLIIGSLRSYEKVVRNYSFKLMNNRDTIKDIILMKGLDVRVIYELDALRSLFLDPMTIDVLKEMDEPTDLISLIIRACELLKDDYIKNPSDISTFMFRGYERLNGMAYHVMSKAIRDHFHKAGRVRTTITVDEYAVKRYLASDATFTLVDDINPIEALKQGEETTLLGMFGRSKETITDKDRVYHPSMIGTLSEATKDNINVGVTTYLSQNTGISNIYGMTIVNDSPSKTATYSTSVLLAPGALMDDGKRALYISIQNKHLVASDGMEVLPYRTGEEAVVPYRVDKKSALHCTEDGKVLEATKNKVTIQYKSGKKTYKLKNWFGKETGGKTYKHALITNLKKDDKVVVGDNIYYDKLYFGEDLFNRKRVCMKTGMLTRMIQTEAEDTFEDASNITKSLANKLQTPVTYVRDIMLSLDVILEEIKRIGDKVTYRDNLLSYRNNSGSVDGLSKQGRELLDEISIDKLKAEVKGEVVNVEIYYNLPKDEEFKISKSVKNLIDEFDKLMISNHGKTGEVDSTFSVRGKGIQPGSIYIRYSVEKSLPMLSADKFRVGNQLKATVGEVFDKITLEDGKEAGLEFGKRGVDARQIASIYVVGGVNLCLEKIQEQFIEDLG